MESNLVHDPLRDKGRTPRFAVQPKDVPELQTIVRTAREEKVGLVPISSGRPHLNGGTSCHTDHAVIDLSGWKDIPWINRRNRVCIVQPGVTFGEIQKSLKESGLTLPMPLAPRETKSVLASVVDREPGTWPRMQWDMQDPVASTEFVYGTGELFRSGGAGSPGTIEEQRKSKGAQKNPLGPGQSDFQRVVMGSQGSMGIVTWISLRAELAPTLERPMLVGHDSLTPLVSYVYEVQRAWLGEHSFLMNGTAAAMLFHHATQKSFDTVRESLPEYICLQNVAGFERLPEERLEYHLADIQDIARPNGLELSEKTGEIEAGALLKIARSPCGPIDWRHSLKGGCLRLFFLSLLDRSERFILLARDVLRSFGIEEERLGVYIQPILQNHGCHFELMVPFDPENERELETMQKIEVDMTEKLLAAGAFLSRPYGTAALKVFGRNPGNTQLIRVAKGLFDPDNILNPGKFSL
ncbi:MAG: FAD-binding oxidoreductase [Proteobacteria bacterium]|nr:FAD-binding oxidoreductase [Pseudomonadota bacterium]